MKVYNLMILIHLSHIEEKRQVARLELWVWRDSCGEYGRRRLVWPDCYAIAFVAVVSTWPKVTAHGYAGFLMFENERNTVCWVVMYPCHGLCASWEAAVTSPALTLLPASSIVSSIHSRPYACKNAIVHHAWSRIFTSTVSCEFTRFANGVGVLFAILRNLHCFTMHPVLLYIC